MPRTRMIESDKLIYDEQYYPRAFADYRTIASYRSAMEAGSEFPPLSVVILNGGFLVLDGWHRGRAFKGTGAEKVPVHVLDIPEREWLSFAVAANAKHGRPYTVTEQTLIVHKLRAVGMRDGQIAGLLSKDESWIFEVAERAVVSELDNGRVFDLKKALIEVKPLVEQKMNDPKVNLNLKGIQKHMSGQDQYRMLEQVVFLAESGLINEGDERVQAYLARLKKYLCS